MILSIDGISGTATLGDGFSDRHLAVVKDIESIISKLYHLSSIIRKPVSLQENARVINYINRVDDGTDAAEFESHVRWQVRFRLPNASEELTERLVKSIVFRRHKLQYRERHQQKLFQGVSDAFQGEFKLPSMPGTQQQGSSETQPQPEAKTQLTKSALTVKSSSGSNLLSATEASAIDRRGLALYPRSVAGGSNVTKLAVVRRDQLDVPPPPRMKGYGQAICPYCFETVDKDKMARPAWM